MLKFYLFFFLCRSHLFVFYFFVINNYYHQSLNPIFNLTIHCPDICSKTHALQIISLKYMLWKIKRNPNRIKCIRNCVYEWPIIYSGWWQVLRIQSLKWDLNLGYYFRIVKYRIQSHLIVPTQSQNVHNFYRYRRGYKKFQSLEIDTSYLATCPYGLIRQFRELKLLVFLAPAI